MTENIPEYRVPPPNSAPFAQWAEYFQWAEQHLETLRVQIAESFQNRSPMVPERLSEYCNRSEGLLEYYRQFNRHEQGNRLRQNVFHLGEMAIDWVPAFALRIFTSPDIAHLESLQRDPPALARLRIGLDSALHRAPLADEFDYRRFLDGLGLLRHFAQNNSERRQIDWSILQTYLLGAGSVFISNPDLAVSWLSEAAQIAQTRLNDPTLVNQILDLAQRVRVEARTAPRLPNVAALLDDLEPILHHNISERHRERFVPTVDELLADYSAEDSGQGALVRLLADNRLLIDLTRVEERRRQFERRGLAGYLDAERIDHQGNRRAWQKPNDRLPYLEQYVGEIVEGVGSLFAAWRREGRLAALMLRQHFRLALPDYDWHLIEHVIERYFADDPISALHLLTPRLEDLCVHQIHRAGIPRTHYDQHNRESTIYLHQLLAADRADVQAVLGEGLFWLAQVFLVESSGLFNIRNRVAHGTIRAAECGPSTVAGLLFIMLHLAHR